MPPWQALLAAVPQLNDAGPFGPTWSMYLRAFVVLSFNSSAYMAEIFRAGIQSINKGQMEAARSLGMTHIHFVNFDELPDEQILAASLQPLKRFREVGNIDRHTQLVHSPDDPPSKGRKPRGFSPSLRKMVAGKIDDRDGPDAGGLQIIEHA